MEEGRDLCQSTTTSESEPSAMIVDRPSSDEADKEIETQLSKTEAFPKSIYISAHACRCEDESCSLPECQLTKTMLSHAASCKPEVGGSCVTCKQHFGLSSRHVEECRETRCRVRLGWEYKQKMAQQCEEELKHYCSHCKKYFKTGYRCMVCDGFDLCIRCFNKDGHVHKMLGLGFDSAEGDQKQSRGAPIDRCVLILEHAIQCTDANCLLSCKKMNLIWSHLNTCKRKASGQCSICKQYIYLNCYHAKNCQQTKCPIPYCLSMKYKLKQRRMKKQQLIQSMELGPQSQMIGATKTPNTARPVPGGARPSQAMSNPGTSTSVSMQQRSNALVLQQLLTYLKSPIPQQKQQALYILKSNPQWMAELKKQRSGQQQVMKGRATIGQPQQQVINDQAKEGELLPQPCVEQQQFWGLRYNSAEGDQEQSREAAIHRCVLILKHFIQCRDANCPFTCKKIITIMSHTKICKRKASGHCTVCEQFIVLACYHAKNCQLTKCPIPYCLNIKYTRKQALKKEHQPMTIQQLVQSIELGPQSQMVGATKMPNTACPVPGGARPSQAMSNPGTSISVPMQQRLNATFQKELLQSLKSSSFPQIKQLTMHGLKSNKQLLSAFMKQRSGQQQVINEQAKEGELLPQPCAGQQHQQQ